MNESIVTEMVQDPALFDVPERRNLLPAAEDLSADDPAAFVGLYMAIYHRYVRVSVARTRLARQMPAFTKAPGGDLEQDLETWLEDAKQYLPTWWDETLLTYPKEV